MYVLFMPECLILLQAEFLVRVMRKWDIDGAPDPDATAFAEVRLLPNIWCPGHAGLHDSPGDCIMHTPQPDQSRARLMDGWMAHFCFQPAAVIC
jgi:hypothetical protein